MGAGKTTALAAAREAGLAAIEVDEVMEREMGMPIPAAFERFGEESFREREAEVVGGMLERADGGAIALGGGSVLSPRIRDALDRHTVVWLQVDPAEAWRRIAGSDRPLATSAADVEELLATRLPLYEELADAVIPAADHGVVARALPAIRALTELPARVRGTTRLLWAETESSEYPVFVGRDLLQAGWWPLPGRRFAISDRNIIAAIGDRAPSFDLLVEIPPGERAKTLAETESILRQFAQAGMTRDDHIAALGGGVVGDLGGFCAHVYQRGVPIVQVPTTLVSQVDSAYGGKTGVDLPEGKNYAGAYHQPSAVITDPTLLASLPPSEIASGFVEALKTALLEGDGLWERVRGMDTVDVAGMDDVIFRCAQYKCKVVAEDETDSGRRHVLNLGHTVGHAIETVTNYAYKHGEAVALGLLATLRLSGADALRTEVREILQLHGLPVTLKHDVGIDEILTTLQRDKKRTAAGVGFVLLSEPGEPRTGQLVPPDEVRAAVEELYG
jgi:shikimate kinase / 3-dehydroquinate synthase